MQTPEQCTQSLSLSGSSASMSLPALLCCKQTSDPFVGQASTPCLLALSVARAPHPSIIILAPTSLPPPPDALTPLEITLNQPSEFFSRTLSLTPSFILMPLLCAPQTLPKYFTVLCSLICHPHYVTDPCRHTLALIQLKIVHSTN